MGQGIDLPNLIEIGQTIRPVEHPKTDRQTDAAIDLITKILAETKFTFT